MQRAMVSVAEGIQKLLRLITYLPSLRSHPTCHLPPTTSPRTHPSDLKPEDGSAPRASGLDCSMALTAVTGVPSAWAGTTMFL